MSSALQTANDSSAAALKIQKETSGLGAALTILPQGLQAVLCFSVPQETGLWHLFFFYGVT